MHLYGQSADMEPIMAIAKKHNLRVIEDGAQAISTQYKDGKCVGTIGDIGCYSFFPSKNLGGYGDGGMVVTMDEELGHKLEILRMHGSEPKYYHKIIGGNFRLDALQAGVLSVKLPHLNSWSEGRRKNAELYTKFFIENGLASEEGKTEFNKKEKILLPQAIYKHSELKNYHIYNQYIIRIEKRDELKEFLFKNEIVTEIYYPIPFHNQECFSDLDSSKAKYPNADFAAEYSLALPIYPELTNEHINYVVEKITEFIAK